MYYLMVTRGTKKNNFSDFITVSEAAELRGVSRAAIHELISRGRLISHKLLGRVVLLKEDVETFERDRPGPKVSTKGAQPSAKKKKSQ